MSITLVFEINPKDFGNVIWLNPACELDGKWNVINVLVIFFATRRKSKSDATFVFFHKIIDICFEYFDFFKMENIRLQFANFYYL